MQKDSNATLLPSKTYSISSKRSDYMVGLRKQDMNHRLFAARQDFCMSSQQYNEEMKTIDGLLDSIGDTYTQGLGPSKVSATLERLKNLLKAKKSILDPQAVREAIAKSKYHDSICEFLVDWAKQSQLDDLEDLLTILYHLLNYQKMNPDLFFNNGLPSFILDQLSRKFAKNKNAINSAFLILAILFRHNKARLQNLDESSAKVSINLCLKYIDYLGDLEGPIFFFWALCSVVTKTILEEITPAVIDLLLSLLDKPNISRIKSAVLEILDSIMKREKEVENGHKGMFEYLYDHNFYHWIAELLEEQLNDESVFQILPGLRCLISPIDYADPEIDEKMLQIPNLIKNVSRIFTQNSFPDCKFEACCLIQGFIYAGKRPIIIELIQKFKVWPSILSFLCLPICERNIQDEFQHLSLMQQIILRLPPADLQNLTAATGEFLVDLHMMIAQDRLNMAPKNAEVALQTICFTLDHHSEKEDKSAPLQRLDVMYLDFFLEVAKSQVSSEDFKACQDKVDYIFTYLNKYPFKD